METNKMTTQIKFTVVQVLKGIAIVIPILFVLLAGYVNIMTKLTQLEQKITFSQENYNMIIKNLDELQQDNKKIKDDLNNHIIQTDGFGTDFKNSK